MSSLPELLPGGDDQLSLAELVNRVLDRGALIIGDYELAARFAEFAQTRIPGTPTAEQ